MSNAKSIIGLTVGLGATAITGLYYWYKSVNTPPKVWKRVGTLSEIYYFPIKSCSAVPLDFADCGILGIHCGKVKDRMFMLVDDEALELVTARTFPKMVKIKPSLLNGHLTVDAPDQDVIEIDLEKVKDANTIRVKIWGHEMFVNECGPVYDKWFSQAIKGQDSGLKLVYYCYSVPTRPIVSTVFKNGIFKSEDTGTLQDVSSYMLINRTSVEELNTRLKDKIEPNQFRPNFVIRTNGPPFEEDSWKWIRIGKQAVFRNVAPCYRCILPNIDPNTGERNPDGEPLKTLKTYRTNFISQIPKTPVTKSPVMGAQLGLRIPGVVQKGDDVFVEA